MKKKISAFLFILVLLVCSVSPVFAAEADGFANEYYRLTDAAHLLSDSDVESIAAKLDEISLRQKMEVAVATTDTLDGKTVVEYADDLYDYCSYGYGENRDGLILVVCPETGDWYISTHGYGITAFTDAGIQYIGSQITGYMSDGDFASAFNTFAELSDEFITKARTDAPYDTSSLPKEPLSLLAIPISAAIGIFLALFAVGKMKAKLKSVRSQAAANSYMKNGSLNITESRELFLYNTVSRTPKPKNNTSGGSSTHTSSSGSTHGGGGGKF